MDPESAFLFDAVPAGLNQRPMEFTFPLLEGAVADGFLGAEADGSAEVIAECSSHQW